MSVMIKTERLLLRPIEPTDLPRLVALVNNWRVASMLSPVRFPYGQADGEAFLAFLADNPEERAFAIVTEVGFIGSGGLHPDGAGGTAIGYWLGEPYWGRGYMSEAAGALVRHAFETDGLDALTSAHFTENLASARVLQKLGFRYSGESERDCLARGCKVAAREMILNRADWTNR
jgi:RimJ/RimL family protein N-acetyltransferase